MVIAAAAPLAAVMGNMPVAFSLGSGLLMPAAFVLTGALLFCFAAGFTAMSRDIVSTGAFYTYVTQGLGKPAGLTFTSISAVEASNRFQPEDTDADPYQLLELNYIAKSQEVRQELRAAGGQSWWHWLAGLSYLHEDLLDAQTGNLLWAWTDCWGRAPAMACPKSAA